LVRGVLFLDYVRMLRSHKSPRIAEFLNDSDVPYLRMSISATAWYPMDTFERMGNAILALVGNGDLFPVQLWGRYSVSQMLKIYPQLIAPNQPVESLNRFRVLRQTFFNFDALDVVLLHEGEAHIAIHYHMGMPAEEAASHQTMGWFEGLLELAGARDVHASLRERSWAGDPRTLMVVTWNEPPPGR
ncbi:MAG: hypothetical protein AB7P03_29930, partial [Kofleriaceae bacterium]